MKNLAQLVVASFAVVGFAQAQTTSSLSPTMPRTFEERLAHALLVAHEAKLLSYSEYASMTSGLRDYAASKKLEERAKAGGTAAFAHPPARLSAHKTGHAADIGGVAASNYGRFFEIMLSEGLSAPVLNDPVHFEIHPESADAKARIEMGRAFLRAGNTPEELRLVVEIPERKTYLELARGLARVLSDPQLAAAIEGDVTASGPEASIIATRLGSALLEMRRVDFNGMTEVQSAHLVGNVMGRYRELQMAADLRVQPVPSARLIEQERFYNSVLKAAQAESKPSRNRPPTQLVVESDQKQFVRGLIDILPHNTKSESRGDQDSLKQRQDAIRAEERVRLAKEAVEREKAYHLSMLREAAREQERERVAREKEKADHEKKDRADAERRAQTEKEETKKEEKKQKVREAQPPVRVPVLG